MRRSMRTTSGARAAGQLHALARRVAAMPTTSTSSTSASISSSPRRYAGWSSATRTRIMSGTSASTPRTHRQHACTTGRPRRGGEIVQAPAELGGSFGHRGPADPVAAGSAGAPAVVGDRELELAVEHELHTCIGWRRSAWRRWSWPPRRSGTPPPRPLPGSAAVSGGHVHLEPEDVGRERRGTLPDRTGAARPRRSPAGAGRRQRDVPRRWRPSSRHGSPSAGRRARRRPRVTGRLRA